MPGSGSSPISLPLSTRSFTSDDKRRLDLLRLVRQARVVHPFPSVLDAVAVTLIALIAGAELRVGLRLGLGMACLQFAIGALNDVADVGADAIVKPFKPIPAGVLTIGRARTIGACLAGLGLLMALSMGPAVLVVASLGLGAGLAYDLRLKRTAFSWAPFAAGVGLLPVYAWVGATGALPPTLALVAVLAAVGGISLALANAWADLEKDRRSGVRSAATVLGPRLTLAINAVLLLIVDIVAGATSVSWGVSLGQAFVLGTGMALGWLGIGLSRRLPENRRDLIWEVQAAGLLLLGAGWLAALVASGAQGH
jgi:4-hydroxybenzoate polyprenyltransferase